MEKVLKEIERLRGVYLTSRSSKLYTNGYLRALRDLKISLKEVKKDGRPIGSWKIRKKTIAIEIA